MKVVLKRVLYSDHLDNEFNLEERDFGFIQDIQRSGLKRTMKRNIGRFRNKIADKIDSSIEKDFRDHTASVGSYIGGGQKLNNGPVERNLIKVARDNNSRVIGVNLDGINGNYTVPSLGMKRKYGSGKEAAEALISNPFFPNSKRVKKKIANELDKGKDIIIHPIRSGTDYLAHEIGHIKNSRSKNPIRKFINSQGNNEIVRENFTNYGLKGLTDNAKGIKEFLKRFKDAKFIQQEEKNATNNALKDLKKLNLTKDELDLAKRSLEIGGNTYKHLGKAYYKTPISNLIHTPGRRNGIGYARKKGIRLNNMESLRSQ